MPNWTRSCFWWIGKLTNFVMECVVDKINNLFNAIHMDRAIVGHNDLHDLWDRRTRESISHSSVILLEFWNGREKWGEPCNEKEGTQWRRKRVGHSREVSHRASHWTTGHLVQQARAVIRRNKAKQHNAAVRMRRVTQWSSAGQPGCKRVNGNSPHNRAWRQRNRGSGKEPLKYKFYRPMREHCPREGAH